MAATTQDLITFANLLLEAEKETEQAEETLKLAKERERRLREEAIPPLMQELEVTKFELANGYTISVGNEIYASIPQANKSAAYMWLDEHGFGGLVKTELTLSFGKGEREEAVDLANTMRENGFSPTLNDSVHAQTLKAWIREQTEAGNEVPLDLFGAQVVFQAKVKAPPKPRAKKAKA